MTRLTVILTAYKRLENTLKIADAIHGQKQQSELWLWDNSACSNWTDSWFDRIVTSRFNAGCNARWWLAAQARSQYVIVMDDDIIPTDPNVLGDTCDWLDENPGEACGLVGVRLDNARSYAKCDVIGHRRKPVPMARDEGVDIIKGRYFALPVALLSRVPMRIPKFEDDIAVSACVGGGTILATLQGRFKELPTGDESVCRRKGHSKERERARQEWFGSEGHSAPTK